MDPIDPRSRVRAQRAPIVTEIAEEDMPVFNDDLKRRVRQAVSALVAQKAFAIPRLPGMALEVMRLAEKPNLPIEQIAAVIKRDQSLAVRLVKAANSALNSPVNRKIVSLQDAIARIGMTETHNIVLAASLSQVVSRKEHRALQEMLWRRSVGAAAACELLAVAIGKNAGQAFVMGLLHDIGRPILITVLDDLIRREFHGRVQFGQAWPVIEDLAPEVSHVVLLQWGLPTAFAQSLDKPDSAEDSPATRNARAMILIARWLMEVELGEVTFDDPLLALRSLSSTRVLGLSVSATERVFKAFPAVWKRLVGDPERTVTITHADPVPAPRTAPEPPRAEPREPGAQPRRVSFLAVGVGLAILLAVAAGLVAALVVGAS